MTTPNPPVESLAAVEQEMLADGVELTQGTAWNFLYRYILLAQDGVPHIVESSELRKRAWKQRAEVVSDWLSLHLSASALQQNEVAERLGMIHRSQQSESRRGENQTGRALEDGLAYLIHKFTGVHPLVRQSIRALRGYEIVAPGDVEQLDLVLLSRSDFRLFVSCLWTSRRDRVAADLYEAVFIHRRRPDVQTAVVTNEYQFSILNSLISSPDIDRVYHVCLDGLLEAWRPGTDSDSFTLGDLRNSGQRQAGVQRFVRLQSAISPISQLFDDVRAIAAGSELPGADSSATGGRRV